MATYVDKKKVKEVDYDPERDAQMKANAQEMVKLMGQYNILISARSIHLWRPAQRKSGSIDGLRNGLEIIATDGLLGWFITPEGEAWCGHIQHFDGKIEPLFSFHGPMRNKSKVKEKSKRRQLIDSL
jgi:hypothetical protein